MPGVVGDAVERAADVVLVADHQAAAVDGHAVGTVGEAIEPRRRSAGILHLRLIDEVPRAGPVEAAHVDGVDAPARPRDLADDRANRRFDLLRHEAVAQEDDRLRPRHARQPRCERIHGSERRHRRLVDLDRELLTLLPDG